MSAFGITLTLFGIYLEDKAVIQKCTSTIIALFCLVLLLTMLYHYLKKVHIIYSPTKAMSCLARIAEKSYSYVWTVRNHIGEADIEDDYFLALSRRVMDPKKPLGELRRLIRLNKADSTRRHLHWLIDTFSNQPSVKIKYYVGCGPSFDFMIADKSICAIGLPMSGGEGFAGTVFFKRKDVIEGTRDAFSDLWAHSVELFSGSSDITIEKRDALKKKVDAELTKIKNSEKCSIL